MNPIISSINTTEHLSKEGFPYFTSTFEEALESNSGFSKNIIYFFTASLQPPDPVVSMFTSPISSV